MASLPASPYWFQGRPRHQHLAHGWKKRNSGRTQDHMGGFYGPGLKVTHNFSPHSIGHNSAKWPCITVWRLGNVVNMSRKKRKQNWWITRQSLQHIPFSSPTLVPLFWISSHYLFSKFSPPFQAPVEPFLVTPAFICLPIFTDIFSLLLPKLWFRGPQQQNNLGILIKCRLLGITHTLKNQAFWSSGISVFNRDLSWFWSTLMYEIADLEVLPSLLLIIWDL